MNVNNDQEFAIDKDITTCGLLYGTLEINFQNPLKKSQVAVYFQSGINYF